MMKNKAMRVLLCGVLIFCLMFSGCAVPDIPADLDDYLVDESPVETEAPVVATESPEVESSREYGVVDISSTENLLAVYYGITFEESGSKEAVFELDSKEYSFSQVVYGVTSNIDNTLSNAKVTIVATVSGYDHIGNKLTSGITSNMTSTNRDKYFGNSNYAHALALTYPGIYYVTYDITIKESAESYGDIEYSAQNLNYTVSRVYTIEKVDAYITSQSDFYFVSDGGAEVKTSADILITTEDGWDIYDEVTSDIYSTSRIELSVPKVTAEVDIANSYELDIVGYKAGDAVDDSLIDSKYFNLNIQNGYRYIIPAIDEVAVKSLYQTLEDIGFSWKTEEYDFSKWDEYVSALAVYEEMSGTEKMLFDLYPAYLLKYDASFSYTDYYNMRACHDWLVRIKYDEGRVSLGEDLKTLVSNYQSSSTSYHLDVLTSYVAGLSTSGVYLADILESVEEFYDSDLAFAVKYAFGGEFENGGNGYVDIEKSDDEWIFSESDSLINVQIYSSEAQFEMYSYAVSTLAEILRGNKNSALDIGEDYYNAYKTFVSVAGVDETSVLVCDIIERYMTFVYNSNTASYDSFATDTLTDGDIYASEIESAFDFLQIAIYDSYDNLLDFQKTQGKASEFAIAISTCETFMLRTKGVLELLAEAESYFEENDSLQTENGVLIYDSSSDMINVSGSENIAKVVWSCSILNLEDILEEYQSEIQDAM